MMTWEEKFIRYAAERWVFNGADPHSFNPRIMVLAYGEDFLSPMLQKHKHFGSLYSGYIGNRLIGYMRVPPGTVILEGVMRCLAFTNVDTVIGLGTCGGLQEDIACGQIVIADSAKAGDCLSMHYGFEYGDIISASEDLSSSLYEFIKRRGQAVDRGTIVTTGAVFRETDELIRTWQQEGLLGVELEAASQFAIAKYMGLRTAMALFVTDSPVRHELTDILRGNKREAFVQEMADFLDSPLLS